MIRPRSIATMPSLMGGWSIGQTHAARYAHQDKRRDASILGRGEERDRAALAVPDHGDASGIDVLAFSHVFHCGAQIVRVVGERRGLRLDQSRL